MSKTIETAKRRMMEKGNLPIDNTFAIISITDPIAQPAKLDYDCPVYRFAFNDITEWCQEYPHLITFVQAQGILKALLSHNKIIVHCNEAYSRSPAVALFAEKYLGFEWIGKHDSPFEYNTLVYNSLIEVYEIYKENFKRGLNLE